MVNWYEALTLSEENPNSPFKSFLNIVDRLIGKYYPKNSPKTNLQTKPTPSITPALSYSIEIKSRVLKQFCKASDPIKKRKLHKRFKYYRNLTTILTRVCKEEYYKLFFQDNKNDFKKIWEGIRITKSVVRITNKTLIKNISLNIDNETITGDKVISNHFNKFSSSVARKLVKKYQAQIKPLIHP